MSKIYTILRIFVAIGWVSFFFYNLYIANYLGQEYLKDKSNFVMFESEQQKHDYLESLPPYADISWVNDVSLTDECKPMLFFNDFYFNKIKPLLPYMAILILITIGIRTTPREWREIGNKFNDITQKIEDEELNDK